MLGLICGSNTKRIESLVTSSIETNSFRSISRTTFFVLTIIEFTLNLFSWLQLQVKAVQLIETS